jgi:hypothetical protein
VRCFNHTIQLSARGLLRLFSGPTDRVDVDDGGDDNDITDNLEVISEEDDDNSDTDLEAKANLSDKDDEEEEEDTFEELDDRVQEQLLEDTAVVRTMLDKVRSPSYGLCHSSLMFFQIRKFFFAVIHSMTIALPAWRKACVANNLPICLILCDVKTCWNSTFDMVKMALKYCAAVDDITANKGLKLHKYELDDDDWDIVLDLLHLLKVNI